MASYVVPLVVGVPQTLPPCTGYRALQNIGTNPCCVTQAAAFVPPPSGIGQWLKKDSTGGGTPTGDGGLWSSAGEGWIAALRLEAFTGATSVAVEEM